MQKIQYNTSFADFRFLQGYMARRIYAKNKTAHARGLFGVVLCAVFLALAIVINLHPYAFAVLVPAPYPISILLLLILCLVAAILSLIPAVKLRMAMLRMQVSDDGPLLGATTMAIEDDGLVIDRALSFTKYRWAALQGVEMAKNAVVIPIDNGIGLIVPSDAARYEFAADLSKRIEAARSKPK